MAKNKEKITISISLSKETIEILNVFKNRSKLIDDILSFLLLKLSPAEMLELIQLMAKDKDVVEFLIKKRCKEIGVIMDKTKKEDIKEEKLSEGDINLNDWW